MSDALEVEFTVGCSPHHAFDVWANHANVWWPRKHTRSGDEASVVTFEPRPGGRVYERTPDGTEHDWGEIIAWEPPTRLVYLWHIYGERADATRVEITFTGSDDSTVVMVRQTGWENLGKRGAQLRERNQHGWSVLIDAFASTVTT
jgi:uncharacterized protein YndB with AHSA1/START domain